MDGRTLKEMLAFLINEPVTSTFLDSKTSFDFIYEAALEYNRLTQALNSTQSITTIALTSSYKLNPDFLCLRLYNDRNELVVEFSDNATVPNISFVPFRPYEQIYQALNTGAVAFPTNFGITDYETPSANLTGAATTPNGSASEDMPMLTASAGAFIANNVSVGDFIHNTTDASDGIVLEVTSATQLKTAMFYGTKNYWTIADNYVIVKQGRKALVFDPPNLTAGYTATVLYVQKPIPVYTNYGSYRFDTSAMFAILKYAAWMYKYRDREPNFGDAFYKFWLAQVSAAVAMTNKAYDRTRFRVNFIKRSLYDRSFR
jgi:hypothetical protein